MLIKFVQISLSLSNKIKQGAIEKKHGGKVTCSIFIQEHYSDTTPCIHVYLFLHNTETLSTLYIHNHKKYILRLLGNQPHPRIYKDYRLSMNESKLLR